jgi:hypothetical protein
MKKDPAIEEVRAVRRKISRRFGNDSKALVAHYVELQEKYAGRLIKGTTANTRTATADPGNPPSGRPRLPGNL